DGQRTLGYIGGVLQDGRVAGHERRSREAEYLPEGEVPGHDRQNDTERLEADVALACIGGDGDTAQEALSLVGKVVAVPGAFGNLGLGLDDRLAHLGGDQSGPARRLV